jgi:23S rRNA (guanine2445-N2)-methyltransferase
MSFSSSITNGLPKRVSGGQRGGTPPRSGALNKGFSPRHQDRQPYVSEEVVANQLFVVCPPALRDLLTQEVGELGFSKIKPGKGGIWVEGGLDAIYRLNYGSRLASRVLRPVSLFRCRNRQDLYRETGKADWSRFMRVDETLAIDVHGRHPEFENTLFAAQVVKDAICDQMRDRFRKRPDVCSYNPDLQIHLYFEDDQAILSVDTSGQPLHKRGYREDGGRAPLQETIAAALIRLSGYDGEGTLCDPCCGSGTLLIEAALAASRTPPGFLRKQWGFEKLPDHDAKLWQQIRAEFDAMRRPLPPRHFLGIEISHEVATGCQHNIRRANFESEIKVVTKPFQKYTTGGWDWVVCNPPFGIRIDETLYGELGQFLRDRMHRPGRAWILSPERGLAQLMGLRRARRVGLQHGGVQVYWNEFEFGVS